MWVGWSGVGCGWGGRRWARRKRQRRVSSDFTSVAEEVHSPIRTSQQHDSDQTEFEQHIRTISLPCTWRHCVPLPMSVAASPRECSPRRCVVLTLHDDRSQRFLCACLRAARTAGVAHACPLCARRRRDVVWWGAVRLPRLASPRVASSERAKPDRESAELPTRTARPPRARSPRRPHRPSPRFAPSPHQWDRKEQQARQDGEESGGLKVM